MKDQKIYEKQQETGKKGLGEWGTDGQIFHTCQKREDREKAKKNDFRGGGKRKDIGISG